MVSVKMAEGRVDRKQNRLATEMNVTSVDENLYWKSLQNRDIPYKTWITNFDSKSSKATQPSTLLSIFYSQNSKIKQPDPRQANKQQNSKVVRPKVPQRCSSLKDTYDQVTTRRFVIVPTWQP